MRPSVATRMSAVGAAIVGLSSCGTGAADRPPPESAPPNAVTASPVEGDPSGAPELTVKVLPLHAELPLEPPIEVLLEPAGVRRTWSGKGPVVFEGLAPGRQTVRAHADGVIDQPLTSSSSRASKRRSRSERCSSSRTRSSSRKLRSRKCVKSTCSSTSRERTTSSSPGGRARP